MSTSARWSNTDPLTGARYAITSMGLLFFAISSLPSCALTHTKIRLCPVRPGPRTARWAFSALGTDLLWLPVDFCPARCCPALLPASSGTPQANLPTDDLGTLPGQNLWSNLEVKPERDANFEKMSIFWFGGHSDAAFSIPNGGVSPKRMASLDCFFCVVSPFHFPTLLALNYDLDLDGREALSHSADWLGRCEGWEHAQHRADVLPMPSDRSSFSFQGPTLNEMSGHSRRGYEAGDHGAEERDREHDGGPGEGGGGGQAGRITFDSPVVQSSPPMRSTYDSTLQPSRPLCGSPSHLKHPHTTHISLEPNLFQISSSGSKAASASRVGTSRPDSLLSSAL